MGSPFDISSLKECTVTTGMGTNFQCLQTQIFSLKPAGLVAPVTTQRRLAPWQTKTRPPLAPCPSRAQALAHRAVDSQLLGQVEEVGEVKITLTAPMCLVFPGNWVGIQLPAKNLPGPGGAVGKARCPGELGCRVGCSTFPASSSWFHHWSAVCSVSTSHLHTSSDWLLLFTPFCGGAQRKILRNKEYFFSTTCCKFLVSEEYALKNWAGAPAAKCFCAAVQWSHSDLGRAQSRARARPRSLVAAWHQGPALSTNHLQKELRERGANQAHCLQVC